MRSTQLRNEALDAQCAEYALGLLHGQVLADFEAQLRRDPALWRRVSDWDARFKEMPMPAIEPVLPPDLHWRDIEARTFGRTPQASRAVVPGYWRWLCGGLTAFCVALIGYIGSYPHTTTPDVPTQVVTASHAQCYVVLTDASGAPRVIVHDENQMRTLNILPIGDALSTLGAEPAISIVSAGGILFVGAVNSDRATQLSLNKAQVSALMAPNARMVIHGRATSVVPGIYAGPIALLPPKAS